MAKELLTLQNVCKYYTSGTSVVMGLSGINLSFRAGEFVAITGESGSGKSTLAHVLGGILPYESGEVLVEGKPTSHYDSGDWERYRRDRISFISQNYGILPGSTVMSNVVSALRLSGMEKGAAAERAEKILREVELWELRGRRAARLSSGQKQRLSIARALAKPAPILIADEPTGNLDRENSEKVISLLAEAAKERLVILITHEFDEAKDCATRHVVIQEGRVAMDAPLRPANIVEEVPARRGEKKELSGYIAGLQMRSRPVWCAIMAALFALTAFGMFAFLGTLIINLDDTHTRIYDDSAFSNGDTTRVVVMRADGESLTEEDYSALLSVKHAQRLERYGHLADITYYYRENVDIWYHYNADMDAWGTTQSVTRNATLEGEGLFLQTVPLTAEGGEFLSGGRLPQTAYEVVAAGDESMLGQRFPVYIRNTKKWNRSAYLLFTVEVVGVTEQGAHLYFSDELGQILTDYSRERFINTGSASMVILPYEYDALIDERLREERDGVQYKLPQYYTEVPELGQYQDLNEDLEPVEPAVWHAEFLCYHQVVDSPTLSRFLDYGDGVVILDGSGSVMAHSSTYLNAFTVSRELFDLLYHEDRGDQVSLYAEDYAYTERVVKEVRELGYIATAPYLSCTTIQDTERAEERMQTIEVCLLALAAVVLLQIVVLRAMFSVEYESYRLLADLGLTCRGAKRSALWQMLSLTLIGEVVAGLALLLCGELGIERIISVLRYLPAPYMGLIWVVHMVLALLATLWITSALRRQVYPVTGTRPDLDMTDDEEVEA